MNLSNMALRANATIRLVLWAAVAGSLLAAPVASAQNFNALPLKGQAAFDAWPGYFWSYFAGRDHNTGIAGGLAYRFAGANTKSPAEKFDIAFGNKAALEADLAAIGTFGQCVWNAKKQCDPGTNRMNQDCLKKTDDKSARALFAKCVKPPMRTVTAFEVVNQGIGKLEADFWWGICHGWGAAAVLFKEPVKDVVFNGVTFTPADMKGYASVVSTDIDLAPGGWIGSRYDGDKKYDLDESKNEAALNDVTPRQYHNFMAKFLGTGKGIVVDRYTGGEVWNQPTDRYETTCSAVATGCAAGHQAQLCNTSFTWAEDSYVELVANGNRNTPHAYTTRNLAYTLCIKDGAIATEGKWNHDPNTDKNNLHPDFLWAPGSLRTGYGASNPTIGQRAAELKAKLFDPAAGATAPVTNEIVKSAVVNKAIPDNKPTGVSVNIALTGTKKFKTFATCLNITHAYKDDLVCTTTYGGKTAKVWTKERAAGPCISHTSFTGLAAGGTATVKCADVVNADIGQWASAEIRYTLQ